MKALVYHGPGKRAWAERHRPVVKDHTAAGKIATTTICGTGLHPEGRRPDGHGRTGPDAGGRRGHRGRAKERVTDLTGKKGVDAAIEAAGIPATFGLCEDIVAAGGHIANIGVHGKSVHLHLKKLWSQNSAITVRLVDAVTTPMLLTNVTAGKVDPKKPITHEFKLDDIMKAYDTFGNAAKEKALKVLMKAASCLLGKRAATPKGGRPGA